MAAQKTDDNETGVGRPSRETTAANNRVTIRLTDAELKAYERAAKGPPKLSIAEWVRACCEARLKRSAGK